MLELMISSYHENFKFYKYGDVYKFIYIMRKVFLLPK